ncbi:MAG: hypothetical protein L0K86_14735 [Actinomycetia bacterium]|nr:hypothetical protein [Actinomycetes bacterium]
MNESISVSTTRHATTWATRGLLILLALCGVVAAASAGAGSGAEIDEVARSTQAAASVPLPFIGVLLAVDVRRAASVDRAGVFRHRALVSAALAIGVALAGLVAATIAAQDAASGDVLRLLPGCVTVQLVSQGIGFGFGLLIGTRWLAMLLDAVVPVGLWALVGAAGLTGAQHWLFPYDSVDDLISPHPTALDWAQEGLVVLLWVVGTVVAGLLLLRRNGAGQA